MTTTGRLYASAQQAFSDWCYRSHVDHPGHAEVARYLQHCHRVRGPNAVAVHLSAIAEMFRSNGQVLDTKAPEIQGVMEPIRLATREKKMPLQEADEDDGYVRAIRKDNLSLRDLDIDAFAEGVLAHRGGSQFHENPHGTDALTLRRLSWSMGWNERALVSHPRND